MKTALKKIRLYCIVGSASLTEGISLEEAARQALEGGTDIIQLREKNVSYEQKLEEAKLLKKLCSRYSVPFIVNDSPELAKESGADGVHLGRDDGDIAAARELLGDGAIIGATAHNSSEALEAVNAGADYIGAGAVFSSCSKSNTVPLSFQELKKICSLVPIPVVAIGGINEHNISELKGSGIEGAAVISAVFGKADIKSAAKTLKSRVIETVEDKC
jgi:thiamine-phosphate pyrophosphorylase